jgi:hypothetical protein
VFVVFFLFLGFLLVVHFFGDLRVFVCGFVVLGERFYEGLISICDSGMCLGR